MSLEPKVKKQVMDAIGNYLDSGCHQAVVVEFTPKKEGSASAKYSVVEDGCGHFLSDGFSENGLKSFIKQPARGNARHGYVLFETARMADVLGCIESDLSNIQNDLDRKLA